MKRVLIDDAVYELDAAIETPTGQGDLLSVLLEAAEREIPLSKDLLVQQFGFKSKLPLESRIRHLAEKGALKLLLIWKDCPICELSGRVNSTCSCCEGTGRIAIAPHDNCNACGEPIPMGDAWCQDHAAAAQFDPSTPPPGEPLPEG
jgi:hypothetical protein